MTLETPLSPTEISELDAFLMSEATSDECMDIVTLDGFLTALVVGPGLIRPNVWLPVVWGDASDPAFDSAQQAERVIGLILRRMNAICAMFGEHATRFEPLLYEREVEGGALWSADDWCWGFMRAIELSFEDWDPLFADQSNRVLVVPILMLGTEEGLDEIDAAADPEAEYESALEMLETSVIAIEAYWRLRRQGKLPAPAARKPGRNETCTCGSGRKFKKCCAASS
jgi:uncharacterized protein